MRKFKIITVENDEDEQFFMKEGFDKTGKFEIIAQLATLLHTQKVSLINVSPAEPQNMW